MIHDNNSELAITDDGKEKIGYIINQAETIGKPHSVTASRNRMSIHYEQRDVLLVPKDCRL